MTLRDDDFQSMTTSWMTVPDDTLCTMQKARGNPQAFYFNLHPKGNYILVFHEHSGGL